MPKGRNVAVNFRGSEGDHETDREALIAWYDVSARDLPWRRSGTSAWGILVSEVLAQQTQVARAAEAWRVWMDRWPTPAALAAALPREVLQAWGNLGYPRRALRLHQAAQQIVSAHGGDVPDSVAALESLPGVGTYTARAVASFAYGVRCAVVDTNVRRVLDRVVRGVAYSHPSVDDLQLMTELLPSDDSQVAPFNAGVMELGATICTNRQPACADCPLQASCRWRALGYPDAVVERRRQPRFQGSLRQMRGKVLGAIRHNGACRRDALRDSLASAGNDVAVFDSAVRSLKADGLIVESEDVGAGSILDFP